jgi:acetyl-CoA carboxylase biotin carboxyl carrier protein
MVSLTIPHEVTQYIEGAREVPMDISELRELVKLFEQADITELEYETENGKIRLKKELNAPVGSGSGQVTVAATGAAQAMEEARQRESSGRPVIPAPMVGIFYRSPAPDAAPFVEVGSVIEEGQTVCIIEAMKLMNEIRSPQTGTIIEVLVENGEPVEFGQPLFVIEPVQVG